MMVWDSSSSSESQESLSFITFYLLRRFLGEEDTLKLRSMKLKTKVLVSVSDLKVFMSF